MSPTSHCLAALCAALLAAPSFAGEIRIEPHEAHFDLAVAVQLVPFTSRILLPKNQSGVYVYTFDDTMFANSAYAQPTITLTWTPKKPDTPATGVRQYFVDIPVTLRSWRADEVVLIEAWPLDGKGDKVLAEYEGLYRFADQWRKLLASLQLADHYRHRLRDPTDALARRAFNAAVTALGTIAPKADWLNPPQGLEVLIRESFANDDHKRGSLLEAMRGVDELIFGDLKIIEEKLRERGRGCAFIRQTFADLKRRREEHKRTYMLPPTFLVPGLDQTGERMEKAACATVAGDPPAPSQ
jgi:hypothetical protein